MVEGHVPVATILRLLSERPAIKGISLPGMPAGSPGMFGEKAEPFTIYEIGTVRPRSTRSSERAGRSRHLPKSKDTVMKMLRTPLVAAVLVAAFGRLLGDRVRARRGTEAHVPTVVHDLALVGPEETVDPRHHPRRPRLCRGRCSGITKARSRCPRDYLDDPHGTNPLLRKMARGIIANQRFEIAVLESSEPCGSRAGDRPRPRLRADRAPADGGRRARARVAVRQAEAARISGPGAGARARIVRARREVRQGDDDPSSGGARHGQRLQRRSGGDQPDPAGGSISTSSPTSPTRSASSSRSWTASRRPRCRRDRRHDPRHGMHGRRHGPWKAWTMEPDTDPRDVPRQPGQALRGPNRIIAAPPRQTLAPIRSQRSGRAPSISHSHSSEAAM